MVHSRVFFHEPTEKAHNEGPAHIVDLVESRFVGLTVCGIEVGRNWHTHRLEPFEIPPLEILCKECIAHDVLRGVEDRFERVILVETFLLNNLESPLPGYKVSGITTGRIRASEPNIQNVPGTLADRLDKMWESPKRVDEEIEGGFHDLRD